MGIDEDDDDDDAEKAIAMAVFLHGMMIVVTIRILLHKKCSSRSSDSDKNPWLLPETLLRRRRCLDTGVCGCAVISS